MSLPEASHAPGGLADEIPLSLQLEFFCELDKGDREGSFGPKHTITYAWRVHGEVDAETMQAALDDVVTRHEMLRTSISRGSGIRHLTVHPPCPVKLVVSDLSETAPRARDRRAEELINEVEGGEYNVRELPHLRAFLGRFGDEDAVLVLIAHHTGSDGWSMGVIVRDLAFCYAARKETGDPELPEVRQYQEYVAWQQESSADAAAGASREYWRDKLKDARILAIPTDRPLVTDVPNVYSTLRFLIDAELTSASLRLSKAMRSSPFMVMLAAYKLVVHNMTGVTDLVVPTFTTGRDEERFHNTVGPFLNFLPLRTDIAGCADFRDVVERVRSTCLGAYTHDIPFAQIEHEAPELMTPFGEPDLDVIAFEVLQFPAVLDGEVVGGLEYSEIRQRLVSQSVSSDIPDGALWALDILPSGNMAGSLKFNKNIFDERTMTEMVHEFRRVLQNAVAAPDAPLNRI